DQMKGRMAVDYDDLRFFSDENPDQNFVLQLQPGSPPGPATPKLDGTLGTFLYVPQTQKVVSVVMQQPALPKSQFLGFKDGAYLPRQRSRDVALIDLSSKKLDDVIKAGRSGIKVGRIVGQVAMGVAIGMATGAATTGMRAHSGVWLAPMPNSQQIG